MEQVLQKTKEEAEALRKKARKAAETATSHILVLAEVLYEIQRSVVTIGADEVPLIAVWGFKDWESYVEQELGHHHNTIRRYVRIHKVFFVDLEGKYDASLLPRSITKLSALSRIVTDKSCEAWLQRAATMSCCELEGAVRTALHKEGEAPATRLLRLKVSAKDYLAINGAVEAYRRGVGHKSYGGVIAEVCRQWLHIKQTTEQLRKKSVGPAKKGKKP